MVHRDLKEANFLVDRSDVTDPEIKVVLSDLGLATSLSGDGRKERQVGTSAYWAPEVWEGNYGLSADVWALGVITYTLFFKYLPFNGKSQVCMQRLQWPCHIVCSRWGRDANDVAGSFVSSMLKKKEADRLTATTA